MRTRRDFIHAMARTRGCSSANLAMQGTGLLLNLANAAPFNLQRRSGKGVKVVILGTGPANLTNGDPLYGIAHKVTAIDQRKKKAKA